MDKEKECRSRTSHRYSSSNSVIPCEECRRVNSGDEQSECFNEVVGTRELVWCNRTVSSTMEQSYYFWVREDIMAQRTCGQKDTSTMQPTISGIGSSPKTNCDFYWNFTRHRRVTFDTAFACFKTIRRLFISFKDREKLSPEIWGSLPLKLSPQTFLLICERWKRWHCVQLVRANVDIVRKNMSSSLINVTFSKQVPQQSA